MRGSRVVKRPQYGLGSVDSALQVLLYLRAHESVCVSDLAEVLGVSPSTAHRLLTTLVYRGFVEQDDGRRYRLGPVMGGGDVSVDPLAETVSTHLRALRSRTSHTATAMARTGPWVRVLATAVARGPMRVTDRTGSMMPAHLASSGKALLAAVSETEVRSLHSGHRARVAGHALSGAELAALLSEFEEIRRTGVAINAEGTEAGTFVVGTAVPGGGPRGPWLGLAVVVGTRDAHLVHDPAVHAALGEVAEEVASDLAQRGLDVPPPPGGTTTDG